MINFDKTFETEQVSLKALNKSDIAQFKPLTADKEMWIFFTDDLSESTSLEKWVDAGLSQMKKKVRLALTVIDKKKDRLIGSTSLGNISERDKRIEIGWTWISKDYQGKGINSQTKYLLLKYCFEELNFDRVEFKTDVLNIPARKALLRIGAIEEGILRSHTIMTNNRRRDTIFYSILKSEWNDVKRKNNWQ